jgi:hypothetical protein
MLKDPKLITDMDQAKFASIGVADRKGEEECCKQQNAHGLTTLRKRN